MTILNFDGPSGRNSRKSLKAFLGVGLLVAAVTVASTLAANININSGPVEFGQGVAQTTACDDSIIVTPNTSFVNGPMPSASPSPSSTPTSTPSPTPTAAFYLETITLSDIDSSEGGCEGKYFTIKAYDSSNSSPLEFYEGTSSLVFYDSGNAFSSSQSGMHVGFEIASEVSIYIHSPSLSASDVYKITVETSDSPTLLQYVSAASCDFDSIGGETETAYNSIAEGLIDGIPGVSLVGDAEIWGLPAATFESFARDDQAITLEDGAAVNSGWGNNGNSTLQDCLNDLLDQSYPDNDSVSNVQAITFSISVPSNISGFDFDWLLASSEGAQSVWDVAAILVDGRDYALLADGKVAHIYNGNLNALQMGFETSPDDFSQSIDGIDTWSDFYQARAIFDKQSNPPDGSGYSVHQITIAAGNTDDTEGDTALFLSNFRG